MKFTQKKVSFRQGQTEFTDLKNTAIIFWGVLGSNFSYYVKIS